MFVDFLVEKASAAHRAVLAKRPPLLIHRRAALPANHRVVIPSDSYNGMKAEAASEPAPIGSSAATHRASTRPLCNTLERLIYADFLRLIDNKARERRGLCCL